ncbi:MAG: transport-associated protein [Verrucomicrobia bacterium]|nr:transport-associated protein [Verrucomicrobiota bacterium]
MNHFKSSLKVIALVALCSGGLVSLQTGCASTPTKESTGEYVDDSAITTKVKAALVKDKMVKAGDVNVETFKGVVQLSGFVDAVEQKDRAGQIAAGVTGVRDVKNHITVK